MTIASTINRNNYIGNGSVDSYDYNFRIFKQEDLSVTVREISSGIETTLDIGTDYTVTGVGELNGGEVVLVDNDQDWLDAEGDLSSDYAISIRRKLALTQDTDIRNQGDFFPEAHEDQFDIATMIDQQQQDEIDRSLKLSETTDPDDFDATIPADLVGAVSRVLMTNPTGDGFVVGPSASEIINAEGNAEDAEGSAELAEEWATKTDGFVTGSSENSSKAYAIGGTGDGQPTVGDAKSWATKTSANVDGSEFSSKEYAQGTQNGTGGSSKSWATKTSANVDGSEFSAKEYAQGSQVGTGGSAKSWAQTVGAAVTGALYSAKEWAVGTFTRGSAGGGSAKDWATYTAGTVDDTERSAKYYAQQALAIYNSMSNALIATESVSNGAAITTNNNLVQNRKVQGNGGAQVAATLALGNTTAVDGIIMRLIGQSDVNTLGLTYSDTNYGLLLNGDCSLGKGDVLTLLFDLTALRWYELSRNF